ncbi:hypothetical protein Salat_1109400 [Sesamum alatum]|uniref:Uncharacterized protein n=1 Tax=Sesamum alatum TaxID=300844 RepID=A0AAE1YPB9_9LAMI|nr:hypothetical protein Salat_1109400 [Sesamum alatum]
MDYRAALISKVGKKRHVKLLEKARTAGISSTSESLFVPSTPRPSPNPSTVGVNQAIGPTPLDTPLNVSVPRSLQMSILEVIPHVQPLSLLWFLIRRFLVEARAKAK